jgi:hypothetical protein
MDITTGRAAHGRDQAIVNAIALAGVQPGADLDPQPTPILGALSRTVVGERMTASQSTFSGMGLTGTHAASSGEE